MISYLTGVDATAPARCYSATALRNNLVHVLRRERFDVPSKDRDARALIEGLLATLALRLLHRDATNAESFVQGRLRRKGTGFWFEDTVAGTAPLAGTALLAGSAARPGSAEARADALLAELAASRIGIFGLPVEYDQPKRKLSPSRKEALQLVEARGAKVLRGEGLKRALLVDPAVVRSMPWPFLKRVAA